jgi:HD-like signal output (HDOD) protein
MHKELTNDATKQVMMGISIPQCPESLMSVMREAKKEAPDFSKVAHLIERDAGLVGPLLKLANSPFVGLRKKVSSVLQAVNVLGMQNTLNLVQNIALRQRTGDNSQRFEVFWERSSLTASVAQRIGREISGVE